MIDEATYDDETLTLEPGDRLYCYTDGAIEALNGAEEEFALTACSPRIDRWRDLPLRAGLDRIAARSADGPAAPQKTISRCWRSSAPAEAAARGEDVASAAEHQDVLATAARR